MEDDFASFGIRQCDPIWFIFVTHPNFQPRAFRQQIPNVQGIAVSFIQAPQYFSVVIQTGRTQYDFLLAVPIHIGWHAVVVAIAIARFAGIVSSIELPPLHQLLIYNIVCRCGHSGIVTSNRHCTGMHAVQIGNRP